MIQWQVEIIRWIQSAPGLEQIMRFISIFGNEEFFLVAIPLIYWCINSRLGTRLAALLIISTGLNAIAKLAFHAPRPYWVDNRIQALSFETTYGIPSAHAQNSISIWGYLALKRRSLTTTALVIPLILLISISRVYLGMHFLTDVLAGWIIGVIILLATVRWQSQIIDWLNHLTLQYQILLSFSLSIIYIVISSTILFITPDIPNEWIQNSVTSNVAEIIAPRSTDLTITVAGLIFGYGASLALSIRQANFSTSGPLGQRALRYIIGVLGTLAIWAGLRYVTPHSIPFLAMLVRYLRYAITMFWILFIAPRVFIKTGLAKSEEYRVPQ